MGCSFLDPSFHDVRKLRTHEEAMSRCSAGHQPGLSWQSTSTTRHLREEASKLAGALAIIHLPPAWKTPRKNLRDHSKLIAVVLSHYILENYFCRSRWSEQVFIISFLKDSKNILNIILYIIRLVLCREVTVTIELFGLSDFMILWQD